MHVRVINLPPGGLNHQLPLLTIPPQGAVVSPTLHAEVTHVVVDKRRPQRFPLLKARLDELRRHPWEAREKLVLDRAWVEESAQVRPSAACKVVAGWLFGYPGARFFACLWVGWLVGYPGARRAARLIIFMDFHSVLTHSFSG